MRKLLLFAVIAAAALGAVPGTAEPICTPNVGAQVCADHVSGQWACGTLAGHAVNTEACAYYDTGHSLHLSNDPGTYQISVYGYPHSHGWTVRVGTFCRHGAVTTTVPPAQEPVWVENC